MIGGRAGIVLLVGFAGAFACSSTEAQTPEYAAAIEQLKKMIREEEITAGKFKELSVGDSKDEVLEGLRSMKIEFVHPELRDEIRITRPGDIEKLRSANGIIVGAGSVRIDFDRDDVVDVRVAPIYPLWKELLVGARTRDEVLVGLRKILEGGGVAIRNIAPDARHVLVDTPGVEGKRLLDRYNAWRVAFEEDSEGFWGLRLVFDKGHLGKIKVWYSPVELP